jgi:glycosyltransferase involved in cell wall biosynthesis
MRILHVMASRANGGAETYATDMIESLNACGVRQLAVFARPSLNYDRLAAARVPLAPQVLDVPLGAWQRRRLRSVIADFRPTLVHCWMRRAASLLPWLEQPAVGWFGGYYDPKHFTRCSAFVGVTPDIVAHIIAAGIAAERVHHVPTFPTLDDAPRVDRALFATPEGAPLLVTLSRLHAKKGLDVLLEALAELPQCIAWLAGDGPLEHELRAAAVRLGVSERVRFLGWRTDRGALLRAADVCVLPSRWEPFGTVMLEAWAAGVPLVAAASQGPSAYVKDGINGLLVPVDDPAALSRAIACVLEDPALKARLIAAGMRDYQKAFTREAVTERMIGLYRQLGDGPGSQRAPNEERS